MVAQIGISGVMGYHNDASRISRHSKQRFNRLHSGNGVKRTGRLICQDDFGLIHQCTRNRNTLPLAAREIAYLCFQIVRHFQ